MDKNEEINVNKKKMPTYFYLYIFYSFCWRQFSLQTYGVVANYCSELECETKIYIAWPILQRMYLMSRYFLVNQQLFTVYDQQHAYRATSEVRISNEWLTSRWIHLNYSLESQIHFYLYVCEYVYICIQSLNLIYKKKTWRKLFCKLLARTTYSMYRI